MKQLNIGVISDSEMLRINNVISALSLSKNTALTKKDFFLMMIEEKEIDLFGGKKGDDFHYSKKMERENKEQEMKKRYPLDKNGKPITPGRKLLFAHQGIELEPAEDQDQFFEDEV